MSRAAKTNAILFIIIIFLSLIAWLQPGLQQTFFHALSALKRDEINTIIIERQGIDNIKLQQQSNGWFLQEPYQLPAHLLRVDTITALAEKRSYSSFQVNDDDLERYHLDKPLISIWLNETKFVIGSDEPINQRRYAMNIEDNIHSDSHTVHLIDGTVFYQLRANLDNFISPRLLPPKSTIKSIAWSDKKLIIEQGRWQLIPDDANVSSDSIAQFIQYWEKAQASRVETRVSLTLNNADLVQSKTIIVNIINGAETLEQSIHYLIIQEDEQIKLLRTDIQVAYLISPQILKILTEFIPVQQTAPRPDKSKPQEQN